MKRILFKKNSYPLFVKGCERTDTVITVSEHTDSIINIYSLQVNLNFFKYHSYLYD